MGLGVEAWVQWLIVHLKVQGENRTEVKGSMEASMGREREWSLALVLWLLESEICWWLAALEGDTPCCRGCFRWTAVDGEAAGTEAAAGPVKLLRSLGAERLCRGGLESMSHSYCDCCRHR